MQTNYYAVINEKTGRLLLSTSRLPIYWVRKVAKQTADRFPGYVVRRIENIHLESIIETFPHASADEMRRLCCAICTHWDVSFDWVTDGSREKYRPTMKMILYMILKKNFPKARAIDFAKLMGHRNHSGVHHSLKRANRWLSLNDKLFMKYYEPVKHFLNEQSEENAAGTK
jgi:hypothetical protein